MNDKKYNLRLTQNEMDELVYALLLLKKDALDRILLNIGEQSDNTKQLAIAYNLLEQCKEEETRC